MPGPSDWRGPRIVITHGRDQVFQIPGTMERDWSDALRHGLESAVGDGKASMAFDETLADDRTVGEAIRSVRRRFYDDPEDRGHPSWLAYTLHCQPNFHVGIARTAVAGAPAPAVGGDE